jgi:redox-sensitive bicupin YhaK (pirin superfamily)
MIIWKYFIPLEGDLSIKIAWNTTVIKEGDIQAMSAGTGIFSEYNKNKDQQVSFLQIWIYQIKKCNLDTIKFL